jgi:hypothetical protein
MPSIDRSGGNPEMGQVRDEYKEKNGQILGLIPFSEKRDDRKPEFVAPERNKKFKKIAGISTGAAALVIAARSAGGLSLGIFGNRKFLRLFIIPVALHGLWDSPLAAIGSSLFLVPTILTALVWVVIMILINMGLSEVSRS